MIKDCSDTVLFLCSKYDRGIVMFGLYINHNLFMISDDVDELFEQMAYLSMSDDATIMKVEG